jgi:hypothetical protein
MSQKKKLGSMTLLCDIKKCKKKIGYGESLDKALLQRMPINGFSKSFKKKINSGLFFFLKKKRYRFNAFEKKRTGQNPILQWCLGEDNEGWNFNSRILLGKGKVMDSKKKMLVGKNESCPIDVF